MGINDFLQVAGSLAFFIYGMKIMSEGIQRAAGSQLRNILRTMTKNRYIGVFTGFLTTAAVQSSSATTVMTVSFVNAGLISLVESAGIMMGANVGTTITGWLVAILGFKFKIHELSIPLFAFGLPMLFMSKGRWKNWGEFIIGFAILFLGLHFLKESVPELSPENIEWLSQFTQMGILTRVIFVMVGALATVIIQSSSAAMTLTLTMAAAGWLPFDVACAMVLGENIGTTITAELASLVGNVHAKRSARIHSMFNIIGVTWMIILMPWFLNALIWAGNSMGFIVGDPFDTANNEGLPDAIAAFHTAFNLTNVILMIGFVPWLVRMAVATVKSKDAEDDEFRLEYISTPVKTPELSVLEAQKEAASFGQITARMAKFFRKLMKAKEAKDQRRAIRKIAKYEEITDRMEIEITKYLTRISRDSLTPGTSIRVRSILSICNDLERIGDVYFQMSKMMERKIEEKIWFSPEQRNRLTELMDVVDEAFEVMVNNLLLEDYRKIDMDIAQALEAKINKLRDDLRNDTLNNLGDPEYNTGSALVYSNMFSAIEKIGDHIMNINKAVAGEI